MTDITTAKGRACVRGGSQGKGEEEGGEHVQRKAKKKKRQGRRNYATRWEETIFTERGRERERGTNEGVLRRPRGGGGGGGG